jgi:hypothetical protein
MTTFRLTRIHIRLCVIRSWKKNVGNAATKVRKMRAIQTTSVLSAPLSINKSTLIEIQAQKKDR